MIYLDHAATTPVHKHVQNAIFRCLDQDWYNPSSSYQQGLFIREKIDQVRKDIADYIHCLPEEIIFTSSGSESNNLAIKGFLNANKNFILLIDPTSHSSIMNIKARRAKLEVNRNGIILPSFLIDRLDKADKLYQCRSLVTINGANNEIGTLQDIKKISSIIHTHQGILHIDAVQLFPTQRINVQELGIDMMSVSGHKFGCPKGIGFLYKRKSLRLEPIISGEQENSLRGGTENTPYIIGLGEALKNLTQTDFHLKNTYIAFKRDYFIQELETIDNTYLLGSKKHRLSNNINMCFKGIESHSLLSYLSLYNIAASSGSACNSLSLTPSHVISALGLDKADQMCCVRFTIDENTTLKEIDEVIHVIKRFKNSIDRGA
ncbi:MAG: cysteine desulfurase family protein [Beduini sp.]|uniref:cysteine desulfurase family protein n=1 Tax=Beduini sp. TaxID=1922300 RepID=UPI0039A2CDD1